MSKQNKYLWVITGLKADESSASYAYACPLAICNSQEEAYNLVENIKANDRIYENMVYDEFVIHQTPLVETRKKTK